MAGSMRKRLIVHGDVQGVFFRDTARRRAAALGVAGWIRNCPDGTVEAVVEGDGAAVAAMASFCAEGPDGARVDRVDERQEPSEGLQGFEVR
jgi:acylphosphatase